jgi:hypothetical protein
MKARLGRPPARPAAVRGQGVQVRRDAARPRGGPALPAAHALDAGTILRLQATAGNGAVGDLLSSLPRAGAGRPLAVQLQAVACPPPPAPVVPADPNADPNFAAVKGKVGQVASSEKAHPPAKAKAAEASAAAQGPSDEQAVKAGAAKVDDLSQQKPRGFDKAAFIAAVHQAIEKATPRSMEEVDDFSKSGKAGELKGQVVGDVTSSKQAAAKDIQDANARPPDPGSQTAKPVTPMAPETPGAPPGDVNAAAGMPPPKPEDQVSLDATKCETDGQLAEAHVTKDQVDKSNEPQFQDAMKAKDEADQHAANAPGQFRADEQKNLDAAKSGAAGSAQAGLSGMHQTRTSSLGHVGSGKDAAKARDEGIRAAVTADMKKIYDDTERGVGDILKDLDGKVTTTFDRGEKAAHDAFVSDYTTKKDRYFDERYSGISGAALWVEDKLTSPPPEVNAFIDQAKQVYVTQMERVIDEVATLIETELNRATQRIQQGRQQIKEYVAKQPADLKKAAQEAAGDIQGQFDGLDRQVTEKSSALVDDLAQKYVAASQKVDEECKAFREENKGLLDKARDKIEGMIDTIKKMKAMLQDMAARAGDVVDKILDDPIGFLGNLIAAVKQGFSQFADNIWTHLKKGLLTWLFGEVAKAGLTIPTSFDLKGILMFLAQLLGLTWSNIRSRAVAILGPKVVGMIEKGASVVSKAIEIYNTIKNEGIAGVWHLITDKVAEIKDQVMQSVGQMVVEQVVVAGIKWVIGLLNPASAFVKACMAIYDIVMWLINHAAEIVALINAVIDNLAAIVAGNIGAAANLVEQALARAVPIAIGFLASLLGLGDLGAKIKGILEEIRKPVNVAVDWVMGNVIKPVIGVIAKGVEWVKGKLFGKKTKSDDQRKADMAAAMGEAQSALEDDSTSAAQVEAQLPKIKARHDVKELTLVVDQQTEAESTVHVEGANSPRVAGAPVHKPVRRVQREEEGGGPPEDVRRRYPDAGSKTLRAVALPPELLAKLKSWGLDDGAIRAIVAKGKNLSAVKGELFEQLGYIAGRSMSAGTSLQFFEGSRFRTVQYKRQFSDGILGILEGDRLVVGAVLEAKAGPFSASKLAVESRETRPERRERYAYAVDLWRDQHPEDGGLTMTQIRRRHPDEIRAIAADLPVDQPGQARRDIERGGAAEGEEGSSLLMDRDPMLDGRPVSVEMSPRITTIIGILPRDVSGASEAGLIQAQGVDFLVAHLGQSSGEIETVAQQIIDASK